MPVSGQIVGGRYRLVRPLGEGGMATVWAAEHLTMGNLVAVKIISTELLDCELALTRFTREARAAAKLRSPYVVQLFDHDVDPVVGPYIAMELLEGESLAERLERERTLLPKDLCRILHQVSKGLMRAHAEGVVHRDMKPDNIFLAIDDEAVETAKILDFGVAKADSPFAPQGNKTVAGALVGTLFYMSPEQAQGREVDHLTDLWALGVIAFESLVGKRPFDDEAPGAVVMQICANPMAVPSRSNPDVPPGFDAWFAQACNRDPAKRFPSADALAQSLAHVCDADELSLDDVVEEVPASEDEVVTSAPKVEKLRRSARKRPVLQLVDSTPPPPPDPAQEFDDMLSLDVEFEFEVEYYVACESSAVGPVSLDTVEVGYRAGYVTIGTWLWTEGWPAWRTASEVFADLPGRRRKNTVPNLELIGPSCSVPPEAPAVPVEPAALAARASSPARATSSPVRRRASKRPGPIVPPPPPPPPFRSVSPLPPAPGRGAAAPPLPIIPPAPPPPPILGAQRPVLPAKPVSAVRPAPTAYYLNDGELTVGPVRASMLRTGLDAGKIAETVLAWRPGWKDWKPVSALRPELEAAAAAPVGMLRSRPGVEAVGMKCRMPVAAPAVASDSAGRSKR